MSSFFSRTLKVLYIFLFFLFLSSCSLRQIDRSRPFEGIVHVVEKYGSSDEMAINTTYFVKSDYLRMESTREWQDEIITVTLYDYNQRKMYTLLPEEKIFMAAILPDESEFKKEAIDPDSIIKAMNAKTGLKKRIHGYMCEQWIFKNSLEGELEMWMTRGFPLLEGSLGQKSDFYSSKGAKMAPFKMIIRKLNGEEIMRWEIIGIDEMRLEDSLFTPPADFKMIKRKKSPKIKMD